MTKETELMVVYLETIKCNPDYINSIKKELCKPQELYNTIKQKCANAQWDYNMTSASDPDVDIYDLFKLEGQIAAYNDVLSLIESMFEVENVKETKI
jgi:hypothetical protein